MSIIAELRKLTGNDKLNWYRGTCPTVQFELNGKKYTLLRRRLGYQLNVEGQPPTPHFIVDSWSAIRRRLYGPNNPQYKRRKYAEGEPHESKLF